MGLGLPPEVDKDEDWDSPLLPAPPDCADLEAVSLKDLL